jgi:hypothetical protein
MNKKYDNNNIIIASRAYFLQWQHMKLFMRLLIVIRQVLFSNLIMKRLMIELIESF